MQFFFKTIALSKISFTPYQMKWAAVPLHASWIHSEKTEDGDAKAPTTQTTMVLSLSDLKEQSQKVHTHISSPTRWEEPAFP